MENQKLKEQLEAIKKLNKENYDNLRKQIYLLNESLEKTYSRPEGNTNEVKKKPVIEVGKVYKYSDSEIHIFMCTGIHESGKPFGYGFDSNGFVRETTYSTYNIIEATKEEWEIALTKYFDKYYEGVEKVDRTGLYFEKDEFDLVCVIEKGETYFDDYGFYYKGRYVMDKNGNIAKPVKHEVKEYTILSFVNNSVDLFNIGSDGEYRFKAWVDCSLSLERCLTGSLKIHSVRRESDGEVFTLGDKIFQGKDHEAICKFSITEDSKGIIVYVETGMMFLPAAKKSPVRKPILVTEDGAEIFEGDEAYIVFTEDTKFTSAYFLYGPTESLTELHPCTKIFSTKEKCEEYIKWNKPMYSLNDVKEALFDSVNEGHVLDVLTNLGKK